MNTLYRPLALFVMLLFLISCEKDNNSSNSLTGKWYRPTNYFECIDFINSENSLINGIECKYRVSSDSIYFQYDGVLYILCHESAHKFEVNYNTEILKIENIDNICFISSDKGFTEYSRQIHPNEFVGRWINQDLSDTLFFCTNNSFKRFYGLFDYAYTSDSMTIQYMGPEKIYVKPFTIKYELTNDTLIMDFKKNYYPDFIKGIRKYIQQ
jgi:hypothetical protein